MFLKKILPYIFIVLCLSNAGVSFTTAADFQIRPGQVRLTNVTKNSYIEITNNSDQQIFMQNRLRRWNIKENERDIYTDTDDLIFFPKLLEIKPKGSSIVRIGWRQKHFPKVEKAYRLFIKQLPVSDEELFAFEIAVPIFVVDDFDFESEKNNVHLSLCTSENSIFTEFFNNSNIYFRPAVIEISLISQDDIVIWKDMEKGWYLFPSKKLRYRFNIENQNIWDNVTKIKCNVEYDQIDTKTQKTWKIDQLIDCDF
jgi:P pilus assembly chaperone PapD